MSAALDVGSEHKAHRDFAVENGGNLAPAALLRHCNHRRVLRCFPDAVVLGAPTCTDVHAGAAAVCGVRSGGGGVGRPRGHILRGDEPANDLPLDDGCHLAPAVDRREREHFLALADDTDGRVRLASAGANIDRIAGADGIERLCPCGRRGGCGRVCDGVPLRVEVVDEVFIHHSPPFPVASL